MAWHGHVHLLDPTGCGLGLAVGLVGHGHAVRYRGPREWNCEAGETHRMCGELARRFTGEPACESELGDCDLLVIVDVFADMLDALAHRLNAHAPMRPGDPLQSTSNPLVYPGRLRFWLEVAQRAPRVAVVDMSDAGGPHEVASELLPQAALFARECARDARGPWRPFPFLYNNVLLWLEHLRPETEWWVPGGQRRFVSDWAFCGTIDHVRYGDRRRRALARAVQRWPRLRGALATQIPFVDVLRVLQATKFGLDLPGAGELCFRVHESLALGTPVLRPEPGSVALAEGLERVVVADPYAWEGNDAQAVRSIYARSYGPGAAAAVLLAGAGAQAHGEWAAHG
ncbi:MAG TPA: hypothetical protein VFZ65_08675 [Planctomycetota bacterium]|nr:hypothetical protein [Planctomycetota bacterium]